VDPRVLAALFIVFTALSVEVVRRGYQRWKKQRDVLAELGSGAPPEAVRRHRQAGHRLVSLAVALIAMVALGFLATLGAPRAAIVVFQVVAIAALALGVYWTVRS
jgi:membrane-bound metal-dependent hydrolase YbcI (DUF457 family)